MSDREIPWIVSTDDHVVEPPNVWTDRLPAKYRAVGPHIEWSPAISSFSDANLVYERGGDGPDYQWWVYEDTATPTPMVLACAGFSPDEYTVNPINFADMRAGCWQVEGRLADMDANHVEASLCFPTYARFCGQRFMYGKDKDLALLCVKAFNDWMVDEWAGTSDGRLLPLEIIPLWDPVAAAAEIRRNAARGVRAVAFSESPTNLGLPSIHSGEWDPFLEACDETGTVMCMHIGSGSKMLTSSVDAPAGVSTVSSFTLSSISLTDWLYSGVLARYPNLKLAYSEGQIGWIPYVLERADYVWENGRAWNGVSPLVVDPPSSYYKDRVFGCFFSDDFGVAQRELIGIDQITFETDYPHQDSTWPDSLATVEVFAPQLSDEELWKVLRGNAYRMLGMEEKARWPGQAVLA